MDAKTLGTTIVESAKAKAKRTILQPIDSITDDGIKSISTTIGSFIVRYVQGKFQRSITFTVGQTYSDNWMEEALYGILYKYNTIKKGRDLNLANKKGMNDGSGMYYRLGDGAHNLKYRNYNIILHIATETPTSITGRVTTVKEYTIITMDMDPNFVTLFERDMIAHRNSLLKIKADSPTVNVFQDLHESDGYTYWEKTGVINKRRIRTIFLPHEQKKTIVDTINRFFASKEYYKEHGIPHNLKILLYGPPGTGKDSIAKMIASEWNRNLYYVTGGKEGRFIPNAISDNGDAINYPLFLISDIDKYPYLINEPEVALEKGDDAKDEKVKYKQLFGNMINALDGVLSGEDRIIIMTTNHIEKFSNTFKRPGRVDLMLEIGYVTPEVLRQYVYRFYGVEVPADIKLKSKTITVADMQFDVVFMKLSIDEFLAKYTK